MAKLIRCPAGHVYDSQAHDECPECARTGVLKPAKEDRKALLDEDAGGRKEGAGKKDDGGKPSKPLPWLAIGGAAVVLLGVAGFFLFRPAGEDKGDTSSQPSGVSAIAEAMSDPNFEACRKTVGDDMPACERAIASKKFSGPALAALYASRGAGHAKKNELDAGIADETEAIRIDPNFAPAFNNRGTMYRNQRKFDDALKDFEQAIKVDPKFPNAYVGRGGLYADQGDFDRAFADFEQAIQADAKYFRTYWARGDAYLKKGDRERAIADYKQALSLAPDDKTKKLIEPALNAATTGAQPSTQAGATPSSAAGADPKSDPDYQTCDSGSGDGVIPACDRAIQSGKFSGNALATLFVNRAIERANKSDADGAISDYTEALRLDAKNIATLNNRGELYRGKGDNDRAIEDFDQAIAVETKEPLLFNNRGLAFLGKGDYDRAIESLDKAIALNSDTPKFLINRGYVYWKKGDPERAKEDYNKALSLNPDEATKKKIESALGELAAAPSGTAAPESAPATTADASKPAPTDEKPVETPGAAAPGKAEEKPSVAASPAPAGDTAAADPKSDPDYQACTKPGESTVEICDRAIASGKFSGTALASLYIGRGADQAGKKNLDGAIADFTEAIKLDPNRAIAFSNRGAILRQKGERDKALEDLDQAIKLDAKYDSAYNNRGLLYADKRDYERAIQDYSKAIELHANYLKAYKNRGDAYRRKGEKALATADYQKALTLNPNDDIKKQINAALYALGSAPPAVAAPTPGSTPAQRTADANTSPEKEVPAESDTQPKDGQSQAASPSASPFSSGLTEADLLAAVKDPDVKNCFTSEDNRKKVAEICDRAINSGKFNGAILAELYANKAVFNTDVEIKIESYGKAIKLDPKNLRAFTGRAEMYSVKGEDDLALQDLNTAIALDAKLPATYVQRAKVYAAKDDNAKAVEDFEEAIKLDPQRAKTYEERGLYLERTKDFDRAMKDYDLAISLDPKQPSAYRLRGSLYEQTKEFEPALKDYDEMVRLDPESPLALITRGKLFVNLKDKERAAADVEKASKLDVDGQYKPLIFGMTRRIQMMD